MKFTIDRKKWARGGINGSSRLLNIEGNMCCLGFYMKSLGMDDDQIRHVGIPSGCNPPKEAAWLFAQGSDQYTPVEHDIARINDSKSINPVTREQMIRAKFRKQGIEVDFIN